MPSDKLYPFAVAVREYPLGSDIGGVTSLDTGLSAVDGKTALAHKILRRLTTPRGGLFYAPSYGFDFLSMVGSADTESAIEQRIIEQVLAEEEVDDAQVSVAFADAGGSRTVTASITVTIASGPFDLVLSASELTASALLDGTELFRETA